MAEVDLSRFEKKIVVRPMKTRDFDAVIELAKKCFPGMKPWKREQLQSHVDHFPEGQLVVEYEGSIIGSASGLIVDFEDYEDDHTFNEITANGTIRNHNPEGQNLYGMEVMVDPDFRGMKIGRRLYDERKELCERLNLESILIAGRIPGYKEHAQRLTVRQYVDEVQHRNIYDPVLTFQLANGFRVKRINKGYLPGDTESLGNAILLEWVNIEYQPATRRHMKTSEPVRICVIQYEMRSLDGFDQFARQVEYFTDVAANYRADFAVFPELITTQLLSFMEARDPATAIRSLTEHTEDYIRLFRDLSLKYDINIIGGSHVTVEEGRVFNVAYMFRRDGTIEKQYKVHVTPNEKRWWGVEGGDKIKVFDSDCGKVAIAVGYDIEFPEMARLQVQSGARILFVPFNTENRQSYLRVRRCAETRAIENQVYTVIAGTVGNLPDVANLDVQYAQSGIFSPIDFPFPWEGVVAESSPNIETIIVGDIDLQLIRRTRRSGTVTQMEDRRRDLYQTMAADPDVVHTPKRKTGKRKTAKEAPAAELPNPTVD